MSTQPAPTKWAPAPVKGVSRVLHPICTRNRKGDPLNLGLSTHLHPPHPRGRHGGGLQSLQHQAVTRGSHQNPAGCRGGSAEIIQTLPTDGRESVDDVRLPAAAFTQVEWLCGMRTQAYRGKRTE